MVAFNNLTDSGLIIFKFSIEAGSLMNRLDPMINSTIETFLDHNDGGHWHVWKAKRSVGKTPYRIELGHAVLFMSISDAQELSRSEKIFISTPYCVMTARG